MVSIDLETHTTTWVRAHSEFNIVFKKFQKNIGNRVFKSTDTVLNCSPQDFHGCVFFNFFRSGSTKQEDIRFFFFRNAVEKNKKLASKQKDEPFPNFVPETTRPWI